MLQASIENLGENIAEETHDSVKPNWASPADLKDLLASALLHEHDEQARPGQPRVESTGSSRRVSYGSPSSSRSIDDH